MAERAALKRQIELLQNLINEHKSVHGDVPSTREEPRWRGAPSARGGPSPAALPPHSSRGRPQSRGGWRKTYSLSNRNTFSSDGPPPTSRVHLPHSECPSRAEDGPRAAPSSSGIPPHKRQRHSITGSPGAAVSHGGNRDSAGLNAQHETLQAAELRQRAELRRAGLPENTAGGSVQASASAGLQIKPSLRSRPNPPSAPSEGATSSQGQGTAKSKFTWVKGQSVGTAEPKLPSSSSLPRGRAGTAAPASGSEAAAAGGSSPLFTTRKTPAKRFHRKLSASTASRTSKYRWVSSSAGAKIPRKSPSPRAPAVSHRAQDRGEGSRKPRAASASSLKIKKGVSGTLGSSSLSSRYRWKAGGQSSPAGGGGATRRRSAFHWTSERSCKASKGGLVPPSAASSSPAGFKLRSRMKIIRRSASSGAGPETGPGPAARARGLCSARGPATPRRTPSKDLVSFGRHKLRRLPPPSSRTGSAPCTPRGPASQRVFRTRYKMVTRPGSSPAHTPHYTPTLSWRTRRIQSARSFLQSRLRAPPHRASSQPWRGSSVCWIRGSLYRVSANKLSRTSSTSISRTGRSFCPAQASSSGPAQASSSGPALPRPSSSRHLASRAVQRSLSIIRQARLRKQQKQFCMYYNRFGRCNRGNSCPFIHDPDKVAVCTRFLRGTCKQADGSCPFSHKVSKEKMPVCSYFLKGICTNSDCPYSHVYVSRKAEVCQDFVKGYCPEGEKCKKKHTLVCPDFSGTGSCPRGSRCKLQHRQRAKRGAGSPARRARPRELAKRPPPPPGPPDPTGPPHPPRRPRLAVLLPQAAPGTPPALPSFISLSSSPEDADAPSTLPTGSTQPERRLQIKPRL